MNVIEAILSRKSIRGYTREPVPRETLDKILDVAIRTPSGLNAQPWEMAVVTGNTLEEIKKANVQLLNSGVMPSPDVPLVPLESIYKQRQVDLAMQLFDLMGIAREDKQKRAQWMELGFRFFDAPAAFILLADRSLDESRTQFDLGAISQTICLAALHYDLGTCIGLQGVMYPQVLRKLIGIPESKRITISISIGYPDWDFPANNIRSQREPVDIIATWHGFE